MTWIVGMPTMFGYSAAISDVRVTCMDGSEHDCLQKIYRIGPEVALGFAGSVRLGFAMIEHLQRTLAYSQTFVPAVAEGQIALWDPEAIAEWLPEEARRVWATSDASTPEERNLCCHLMLLGAVPDSKTFNGRGSAFIFKSPHFAPEPIVISKVGAIGSGAIVPACREAVERINSNYEQYFNVIRHEAGMSGGAASILGITFTGILEETCPKGISPHLHICWTYPQGTVIKTNNHAKMGRWSAWDAGSGMGQKPGTKAAIEAGVIGTPKLEGAPFEMPRLARSWHEFNQMLGALAAGCAT